MPEDAMSIGGGISSTFLNNILGYWREGSARKQQYEYGEQAAENAKRRAIEIYEKYDSPNAKLKQFKGAGLSPSMMYENMAAGSVGAGMQGEGSGTIAPNVYGLDPTQMAQIELLNSEARKNNAEADRIMGNNKRGKAEIDKLIGETKNIELKNQYAIFENKIEEINAEISEKTKDYNIEISGWQVKSLEQTYRKLIEETKSAGVKAEIDEQTKDKVIQEINNRVIEQAARITLARAQKELTNSNIQLNDQQIEKLYADIVNRGEEIDLEKQKLHETIKQWAIENENKDQDQAITIANIIVDAITDSKSNLTNLLTTLIKMK